MLLLAGTSARAIVTDEYDIQLPSGSLHKSFIALGQQTNASIIFPSSLTNFKDIKAIKGSFSIIQALEQLIAGRDLEYRVVGPLSVVVLPRCKVGRLCQAMEDDTRLNTQQYAMIEELIVRGRQLTGSRFKRVDDYSFSPVEIITATEIRLTGAQTLSQLLRYTPEVAGNSASTAVSNGGNGSASVTLRGLPSTNTLVLINGLRTTSNALDGGSVDLNSIPAAAIDRIEILKDSGSSVYGSDAIAGVVNVILRKSMDGTLINAYYGAAQRGDNQTRRYDLVVGGVLGSVEMLMAASHYDQAGIFSRDRAISRSADGRGMGGTDQRSSATPSARIVWNNNVVSLTSDELSGSSASHFSEAGSEHLYDYRVDTSSLVPSQHDSVYFSANLSDLDSVDAAFDLSYIKNQTLISYAAMPIFTAFEEQPITISAENQFNPFGEDITDARIRLSGLGPRTQENQSRTLRARVSLMGGLAQGDWQTSLNWSRNSAEEGWRNLVNLQNMTLGLGDSAVCAAIDGCVPVNFFGQPEAITAEQLNYIRADAHHLGESTLTSFNFDLSQVFDILPAGELEFAAGFELRRETLITLADQRVERNQLIGGEFGSSHGKRSVSEIYLESLIPLLNRGADGPWLEANLSLRATRFSDFGSQINPKLALRYRPNKSWMLRGSVSSGFRAPSLFELNQSDSVSQAFLLDPCSISGSAGTLPGCLVQSDSLRVQYPTVTGGNAELRPETSDNVSFGFIYSPVSLSNFSIGMDVYQIEVNDIIGANGQFFLDQNAAGMLYGNRVIRDADGELIKVIANNENLGVRSVSGMDMDVSWRVFIPKWGTLGINVSGSNIASYKFQSGPRANVEQLAGTFEDEAAEGSGTLPKWKTRLNLFWQFGDWEVGLSSFRVSGVIETVSGLGKTRDIGVWSREDVQISRHFNSAKSLLTVGVENIFDQSPPFMASAFNDNFDTRTYDSVGRYAYIRLSHHL